MTKQELAGLVGISSAYLSQIESGIRANPKIDIIADLITYLHLTEDEVYTLYDLYADITNSIPIDVADYIKSNDAAVKAIREAAKLNANESEWERFIEKLNK